MQAVCACGCVYVYVRARVCKRVLSSEIGVVQWKVCGGSCTPCGMIKSTSFCDNRA